MVVVELRVKKFQPDAVQSCYQMYIVLLPSNMTDTYGVLMQLKMLLKKCTNWNVSKECVVHGF